MGIEGKLRARRLRDLPPGDPAGNKSMTNVVYTKPRRPYAEPVTT